MGLEDHSMDLSSQLSTILVILHYAAIKNGNLDKHYFSSALGSTPRLRVVCIPTVKRVMGWGEICFTNMLHLKRERN